MQPWTFVHVTDIHVGSPRSFRFAPAWNENWQTARHQMIDINPDLLLVGGDVARDGQIHAFELEAIKEDLDALPFPYHVVPGNMDIGNKRTETPGPSRDDIALNAHEDTVTQFASVFGGLCWSFVHNDVRFSGFCDILAGSGLPQEQALWAWLEAQTKQPRVRHHVWLMHYALFIDDPYEANFDIRDPEHYTDWYFGVDEPERGRLLQIFKDTHADIVLSGHIHCRKAQAAEGIRFYKGPSTAFPQWKDRWEDGDTTLGFLKFDVSNDGIASTFVPLERTSDARGYGPGGHPGPEDRDYSLAWEK